MDLAAEAVEAATMALTPMGREAAAAPEVARRAVEEEEEEGGEPSASSRQGRRPLTKICAFARTQRTVSGVHYDRVRTHPLVQDVRRCASRSLALIVSTAAFVLLFPFFALGCSSEVEAERVVVSPASLRRTMTDLNSHSSSAPLEDQSGKRHDASDETYIAIAASPETQPYYSAKLATIRAACGPLPPPGGLPCPLANPAASYSATFEHLRSQILWGPIVGGTLAVGIVGAEVGCFAAWCNHDERNALIVTDVVIASVVVVAFLGGELMLHWMLAGTRGD
jgi:hypothetical protein